MEKEQETKGGMEEFFIRDAQNEGIEVPLYRPDGTKSDHSLVLYGHFSDKFQRVRREIFATAQADFKALKDDPEKRDEALEERRLRLTAALIKSWSFPQPCSERQKVKFLRQAPQIAEMIDRVAGEQELFTRGSSNGSSAGSDGTSSSQSPLPDPAVPSEST